MDTPAIIEWLNNHPNGVPGAPYRPRHAASGMVTNGAYYRALFSHSLITWDYHPIHCAYRPRHTREEES